MPVSQNGWSANDRSVTQSYTIPGTTRAVRLRKGDAGFLLCHFAAWFDKNIESIDNDKVMDDWGYAERPIRGSSKVLSNHASATALDLNATRHPLGKVGTFLSGQYIKIRRQLKVYRDPVTGKVVLRHGIDYHGRKDEMHVEIVGTAAQVARVAAKLRGTPTTPRPTGELISLGAIAYAAKGGYFHLGQKPAEDDARSVLTWLGRVRVASARDIRVWEQLLRAAKASDKATDWKRAGAQYAGIIRRFQVTHGLTADGVVGANTKAKFKALLVHDNYRVVA
ncbi:M15 family metallopeptidase [Kribbella sp. NBC_01505]|uniref:hypothetical protein n=1 Tax=Kribbella sp. NBC_01505 TaxID=2903580 RepID=UPI0038696828